MYHQFKITLFLLTLLLISPHTNAQQTPKIVNNDSINYALLLKQSGQLQQLEKVRVEDSLKKLELQKQIQEISSLDNTKKQSLINELESLKNLETERYAAKKHKIDSIKKFVNGYAVVPFIDDTLFTIYTKIGSLSAKDRAEAISNRIRKISENYFFTSDSIQIVPTETTFDLVYGELIVMSISEYDGLWQNTSKESLAVTYKTIISNSIIAYKNATSWQTISKQIGLAAVVIMLLILFIILIVRLFKLTQTKIENQKGKLIKGIKIRNYELFTVKKQLAFLLRINTVIKWFFILLLVYLTLTILFGIFPWTKGFADKLVSYFLNPFKSILLAIWDYLPNLITIIVIVFVFRYVMKGVRYFKIEIERGALSLPGFYPDWAKPTYQIINVLFYAFMFIVIFPYLPGSDSPVFQGVSVFLGVLFTFGSSGSLSNVIAGLVLTYMRAFKIGDRVQIGDITGDIIEKSLLVTRIRTIKNEIISIPNSNVMSSHTINYSSDAITKGLIMHTTVTIGYDVPWKNVHQALINAALRTEFILDEPQPFVMQTGLEDFYVAYQINAYTKEPNKQAIIYSQLHQNIQDCFNEAGIEIMSPHYRAGRDGNTTTIPAEYLEKDYKSPPFNIKLEKDNT